MNIIDNAIMSYSLLWPGGADGVAGGEKTGAAVAGRQPGASSQFVRPESVEAGSGTLPVGMGENVDLMV
ncbi:MAG: hypothetical protein JXB06_09875 [Spirochaetales bacterium]|nr:hypothetical protein [Spirochaetales bacterium]